MMIEKVMIQLEAKNLQSSCRMMIENVMIQLGVHSNRKGGGGGHWRDELAMLVMQEARKAEDAKSQSQKAAKNHKAKKPPAAAELAMQRIRKDKQTGTVNAEDAK